MIWIANFMINFSPSFFRNGSNLKFNQIFITSNYFFNSIMNRSIPIRVFFYTAVVILVIIYYLFRIPISYIGNRLFFKTSNKRLIKHAELIIMSRGKSKLFPTKKLQQFIIIFVDMIGEIF